jgi:hypothetical protein
MEKFTKFLKDVLTSTPKLLSMNRLIVISPHRIANFSSHAAYNTAAFSVAALLIVLCVNFMSPGETIGISVGILTLLVSIAFFSILGFFVNLAAPALVVDGDKTDAVERAAVSLANKWATYAVYCFFLTLAVYAIIYVTSQVIIGEDLFTYCQPADDKCLFVKGMTSPELFVCLSSAFLGTAIVYSLCGSSGKIQDGAKVVVPLFAVTCVAVGSLVYLLLFWAFV